MSYFLRVQNDILKAVDDGKCALLVLLHFSSVFNTVNHTILLQHLENTVG